MKIKKDEKNCFTVKLSFSEMVDLMSILGYSRKDYQNKDSDIDNSRLGLINRLLSPSI